jgi:hypothetical protein
VKPILFVFGPSGVGKSHLSKKMASDGFLYVHIDTDSSKRSFAANGFPAEWDADFSSVKLPNLVAVLQDRLKKEHAGAVVSFPTTHLFTPEMLAEALRLGATPLLLWGTREHCVKAAQERIRKKGYPFNASRYQRLNGPAFAAYSSSEYAPFRVDAFRDDGSRFSEDEWVAGIMGRPAG